MAIPEKNLQKIQLWIAILAGTVTFLVGAYNLKKILYPKPEVKPVETSSVEPNPIRSAVEDVGAEWIKKWGKPESYNKQ